MALNLRAIIGTITGKLAFERTHANFQDIQTEVNEHLAESVSQGDIPHIGLGGSISGATGAVSTPDTTQVNASTDCKAIGNRSQINASESCEVSGIRSQINTSRNCIASGSYSSILSSYGVINPSNANVSGGYDSGSEPSFNNTKWRLVSTTGNIEHSGTISTGHSFADFAEVFPNITGKEQEYGLLQTIDGFGVRPANDGERVIGVTSATAGIILGDTPFSWQGRWIKDEWGAYIYEEVYDEELDEYVSVPKENPEWDSTLEQLSRKDRPDEWTVVGLIGQVYVRLKEDVEVMDYVKAWQYGIGQRFEEPTNLQVMRITQEYDEEKGYKIGFCLLK